MNRGSSANYDSVDEQALETENVVQMTETHDHDKLDLDTSKKHGSSSSASNYKFDKLLTSVFETTCGSSEHWADFALELQVDYSEDRLLELTTALDREGIHWTRWTNWKKVGDDADHKYVSLHCLLLAAPDERLAKIRVEHAKIRWKAGGRVLSYHKLKKALLEQHRELTPADHLLYLGDFLLHDMGILRNYPKLSSQLVALHQAPVVRELLYTKKTAFINKEGWIKSLRDNVGDQVAWHYALLGHYTLWTIPVAIVGMLFQIIKWEDQHTYEKWSPVYSFAVLMWAATMVRFWVREENELQQEWGLHDADLEIHERDDFRARARVREEHFSEEPLHYVPICQRAMTYFAMAPIVLIMFSLILLWSAGCFLFENVVLYYDCAQTPDSPFCDFDPARPTAGSRYGINFDFRPSDKQEDGIHFGWILTKVIRILPGVTFALAANVLWKAAVPLTTRLATCEAHKFQVGWERSVIFKTYIVQFLGVFGYFFMLAFIFVPFGNTLELLNIETEPIPWWAHENCPYLQIPAGTLDLGLMISLMGQDFSVDEIIQASVWKKGGTALLDPTNWARCKRYFREERFAIAVVTFFSVKQIVQLATRTIMPMICQRVLKRGLCQKCKDRKLARKHGIAEGQGKKPHDDGAGGPVMSPWNGQEIPMEDLDDFANEMAKNPHDLFGDYAELMSQFSLMMIFCVVYPMMPVWIVLINLVWMRTHKWKMVKLHQRPLPLRRNGIGAWGSILQFVTTFSVLANLMVLCVTFDTPIVNQYRFNTAANQTLQTNEVADRLSDYHLITLMILAIGFERIVLVLQLFVLNTLIPERTQKVTDSINVTKKQLWDSEGLNSTLEDKKDVGQMDVTIDILSARNLPKANGCCRGANAYVILHMQESVSKTYRTPTKFRTSDPHWDRARVTFTLLDPKKDVLKIDLRHDRLSGFGVFEDKLLCKVSVPLEKIFSTEKPFEGWINLRDVSGMPSRQGESEIFIKIAFTHPFAVSTL